MMSLGNGYPNVWLLKICWFIFNMFSMSKILYTAYLCHRTLFYNYGFVPLCNILWIFSYYLYNKQNNVLFSLILIMHIENINYELCKLISRC